MEALAVVRVKLQVIGGAPGERRLGAEDAVGALARVGGERPAADVVTVEVAAQAENQTQAVGQRCRALGIEPAAILVDLVLPDGADPRRPHRLVKPDLADRVVAPVAADREGQRNARDRGGKLLPDRAPEHAALVALLELVAVHRVVEKISEVRGQAETVIQPVEVDLRVAEMAVARQPDPRRLTAEIRVDVAEAPDQPAVDRALRHLVGRIPGRVIGGEAEVPAARRPPVANI